MIRYRTDEEIRRYDLMKLGVLLLLLALLALTWYATRDQQVADLTGSEVAATPVAEEGETSPQEPLPAPTLAAPSIAIPSRSLTPGNAELSGTAGPGAQIVILVNGQPAGAATAGVDGAWSAAVDLPPGDYSVQVQTVDNVGSVVGESPAIDISVGGEPETTAALSIGGFDPVSATYSFAGLATPGDTITILSDGAVIGSTTADEAGDWSITIPADAITGDVAMQATDASGNVTQQSEPVTIGSRPPTLNPPLDIEIDPASGEATLPVQPGAVTWTGQGEPGSQVELLIDGLRAGIAAVGTDGSWSLPVDMPAGSYTLQLNSLASSGEVLASTTPINVVAGDELATATETPAATNDGTIAGALAGRPEFSTLWAVLQSAELTEVLREMGPFTAFAPTNDAFALLPQRVMDGLAANPQVLSNVLQYHIVRGLYPSTDLVVVQPATLNGRLLTIVPQDDTLTVNDAVVTEADIINTNGIIHAIDRILVPPLAEGVRPPVIDSSGVATFKGNVLTIVGTAEPNRTILVEMNGEAFGEPATVSADGSWSVVGNVTPGDYQIVAYMLNATEALEAISRPVTLQVSQ